MKCVEHVQIKLKKKKKYEINPINIFQISKTTTLTMDPLDTLGQDAHLRTEGSKVAKTEAEKTADEGNEVVLEKSPMDKIADTLTIEGPNTEGSEMLNDDDEETSEEEDNIPPTNTELNEASSRGRKKRLLVIDLKEQENSLDKKTKQMEASETEGGEPTAEQKNESTSESNSSKDPQE